MGDAGRSVQAGADVATTAAELAFAAAQAKRAREREAELRTKMTAIENRRMEVINPYDKVEDLSDMISDLSSIKTNPYANMGIATRAAEMQIEQSDIALANTLDTLAATGASAGGATALAQAALQSKKGVASTIEAQELANEKNRAAGQEMLENARLSEAQRVQAGMFGEAQRLQMAGVLGDEFVYGETERRDANDLNRYASLITGASTAVQDANKSVGQSLGKLGNTIANTDFRDFSKKPEVTKTKAKFSDGSTVADNEARFEEIARAQQKGR